MAPDRRFEAFLDDVAHGRLSRREVFKRGAALGIGASALSTVLAARPGLARRSAQEAGTLNLSSNNSDPEPRRFMEQVTVPDFTARTGVQVELNTVNHEDFKQAIRTYLASGDPPDVLTWFAGNRMRFFVERELVMPVTDVYQAEGWENAYPQGVLAVSRGADNEYYFVPSNYYGWAIYYRPSLFQQAGIEAPPQTFEELLTMVETLKGAGLTPFTLGTKAPWPAAAWFDYLNMRTNGPEFHVQLTDGQAAYNSPEVKETFANWRRLLDAGAFIEQPEALEWQDALTPMLQGEAAMYLMGGFITDSMTAEQEQDLDFFSFPKIADVPVGEDAPTDGYFVAANARNVEEAKQFLAFVGGREHQEAAARDPELARIAVNTQVPLDIYPPLVQKQVQMLQAADYVAQFYDRDTAPEMADKGMAAFVQFMNQPDDVDLILDDLDEERKRIFESE